jgi:hypothetical protein
MRRGFSIFWMLYAFFFAVPFPMLLYYNIKSEADIIDLKNNDPWLSLGLLVISMLLWVVLLIRYFRKWLLFPFVAKRNIEQLKRDGVRREADILSAAKIPVQGDKYDNYELTLSFENLVGTTIVQKAGIIDGKPHERRFEVGKKTAILIDKDMKRIPYFIFANSDVTINGTIITLITVGWLALSALIAGYYIFSYHLENYGAGWSFMVFWHPLMICPIVILFSGFLENIMSRFGGSSKDAPLIKFKGIRTTARLISASQTGLYINEQPQIEFSLEYTDERQQAHKVSIKKIIDLLDLDITRQKNIDIFYLRDDAARIAFVSDLDEIS